MKNVSIYRVWNYSGTKVIGWEVNYFNKYYNGYFTKSGFATKKEAEAWIREVKKEGRI